MKIEARTAELNAAVAVAENLCAAARTAPKGCGIDHIETLILTGAEKDALADEMIRLTKEEGFPAIFERDARCLKKALAVVLIGSTRTGARGLNCTICGYDGCAACLQAGSACAFEMIDLGIALGSAVGLAADRRVDTRIMYTVGRTALKTGLLSRAEVAMGVPVSISGKSPFFDRG